MQECREGSVLAATFQEGVEDALELRTDGSDVVNVILVDFRGVDTLGETTVIALAAVFAWSLLGPRTARERVARAGGGHGAFILLVTSRIFFWLLAGSSVVLLLRGHNEVGGGFVGGLAAALAFAPGRCSVSTRLRSPAAGSCSRWPAACRVSFSTATSSAASGWRPISSAFT